MSILHEVMAGYKKQIVLGSTLNKKLLPVLHWVACSPGLGIYAQDDFQRRVQRQNWPPYSLRNGIYSFRTKKFKDKRLQNIRWLRFLFTSLAPTIICSYSFAAQAPITTNVDYSPSPWWPLKAMRSKRFSFNLQDVHVQNIDRVCFVFIYTGFY